MSRTGPAVACRLILVVGVVACLATTAVAQGVVRGLVRDQNGQGISGATVIGEELSSTTSETTTTNDSGRFALIGLRGGEWRFVIRADGFQPTQRVANVIRSGTTAVQLTMERDRFNPAAPTGGVLAGLKTADLVEPPSCLGEYTQTGNSPVTSNIFDIMYPFIYFMSCLLYGVMLWTIHSKKKAPG